MVVTMAGTRTLYTHNNVFWPKNIHFFAKNHTVFLAFLKHSIIFLFLFEKAFQRKSLRD
jgi:hypothetical protein